MTLRLWRSLTLLLMLIAPSAEAAIAQAQVPATKDTASSASDTLAYGSNVTSGSLLVLSARVGGNPTGRTTTVSDSLGQTWSLAQKLEDSVAGESTYIYYFMNSAAGANTVTLAISTTATSMRWAVHEYSGAATTNVVDKISTNTGTTDNPAGTAVTTTADGEMIFGAVTNNAVTTYTAGTGYTLATQVPAAPNTRHASEHQLGAVTGTYTVVFTGTSGAATWQVVTATFKVAGGAAAVPTRSLLGVGTN